MPYTCLDFRYFPVGQGLFSVGRLRWHDTHTLTWVYDCGTLSDRILLKSAVAEFDKWHAGPIDLVALSHFDQDHVNGICDLIGKHPVRILLLPYVIYSERVRMALAAGIQPSDPFLAFFTDPAAYFLRQFPDRIERVLFVPPSAWGASRGQDNDLEDSDGPVPADGVSGSRTGAADDERLTYDTGKPDPDEDGGVRPIAASGNRVAWLRPDSVLRVGKLWEFVPYNDAVRQREGQPLDLDAVKEFMQLPNESTLANVRSAYERTYGSNYVVRNRISLFLYAGPQDTSQARSMWTRQRYEVFHNDLPPFTFSGEFPGWLATGDGYLNTPKRLDRLKHHLGRPRIERIKVFQVMHHGARGNWCPAVKDCIKPQISIFSSDCRDAKSKHPHHDVWWDFREHGPIQVDRTHGFWITNEALSKRF